MLKQVMHDLGKVLEVCRTADRNASRAARCTTVLMNAKGISRDSPSRFRDLFRLDTEFPGDNRSAALKGLYFVARGCTRIGGKWSQVLDPDVGRFLVAPRPTRCLNIDHSRTYTIRQRKSALQNFIARLQLHFEQRLPSVGA